MSLKMKIDSNFMTSHKRGSLPTFSPRVIVAFCFCAAEFSRFSSAPFRSGFQSPARLPNTDNQKRSIFSTNEGGEQLNYSDDAGPRSAFLCLGRTGLASVLSGCCWLAPP